ncbi:AraC family transcriptional regulator [Clostridium chromiireducens]|nr:AraC family transcriptional regulator [Clostridium chromiireducens]
MDRDKRFLENREHGDIFLPLNIYDSRKEGYLSAIDQHWHKETEITLVVEGDVIFKVNKDTYHASKGDVIIISPYNTHSAQIISPKEGFALTIVFDLSMLKSSSQFGISYKYIDPILEGKRDITAFIPSYDKNYIFAEIIKNITDLFVNEKFGYELEINSELLKFLYNMYKKYEEKYNGERLIGDESARGMKKAIDYINDHYNDKITIKELASITNYSESYFMHYFKNITNLSVIEYIIKIRLVKSLDLLAGTELSITDISGEIGFNSVSYFTKLFKKQFKLTPIKYRKNIKIQSK